MSWADDTDALIKCGTVVTVKKITQEYNGTSVIPESATAIIETSTVLIFPKVVQIKTGFDRSSKGFVIESSHVMFFPATSSVAVSHRVFEPDETDYHEVVSVADYEGHKQVYTQKVENR